MNGVLSYTVQHGEQALPKHHVSTVRIADDMGNNEAVQHDAAQMRAYCLLYHDNVTKVLPYFCIRI